MVVFSECGLTNQPPWFKRRVDSFVQLHWWGTWMQPKCVGTRWCQWFMGYKPQNVQSWGWGWWW